MWIVDNLIEENKSVTLIVDRQLIEIQLKTTIYYIKLNAQ